MQKLTRSRKSNATPSPSAEEAADLNTKVRARRGRYISDSILERRRRMLEVAKEMIAEGGSEAFTVRELGRRAEVSITTIYAAFGDKEGLIAVAIQDYYDRLPVAAVPPSVSLTSVLKATELVRDAILVNKSYAQHYAELYFNTADARIHDAIKITASASAGQLAWMQKVMRDGDIVPGLSLDEIIVLLANHRLMVLHDWAQGRISDDDWATATTRAFLIMARGVTRGATQERVDAALKKVLRSSRKHD